MVKRWRGPAGGVGLVVGLAVLIALVAAPLALASGGASGAHLWTWSYSGTESQASLRDTVTGPGGAVYAVGSTASNGGAAGDILVVKFNASGSEPAWTRTWDGSGYSDYAWACTTDRAGNVVVAGMAGKENYAADWAILKYSPSGEPLWSTTVTGEYASANYVNDVVCDAAGNVYAGGSLLDETDNHCFAVARLRGADGQVLWTQIEPGLNADWHDDQATELAVDAVGSVYATGISFDATRTDRRCLTMKITRGGDVVWRRTVAPAGLDRYGYFVRVVGSSLYVGLFGNLADDSNPLLLAKYTTAGRRSWLKTDAIGGGFYPLAMAANATGVAFIGAGPQGAAIAKFTPGGKRSWAHVYKRSDTRMSRGFDDVRMDAEGRVWVAGGAATPAVPQPQYDWLVQRFSPGGRSVWVKMWGGDAGGPDSLGSLTFSGSSLFVAGAVGNADGDITEPAVGKFRR